jgi:hypothetical protein
MIIPVIIAHARDGWHFKKVCDYLDYPSEDFKVYSEGIVGSDELMGTIADMFRREGHEKGLILGRQEGQQEKSQEMLIKSLTLKCDHVGRCRILQQKQCRMLLGKQYRSLYRDRSTPTQSLEERFTEPDPLPGSVDPVSEMKHKLKTKAGKELYSKRKCTVEPVFGIIKAAMGFRQFLLRGLESVAGEWNFVCIAYNIKRLYALSAG